MTRPFRCLIHRTPLTNPAHRPPSQPNQTLRTHQTHRLAALPPMDFCTCPQGARSSPECLLQSPTTKMCREKNPSWLVQRFVSGLHKIVSGGSLAPPAGQDFVSVSCLCYWLLSHTEQKVWLQVAILCKIALMLNITLCAADTVPEKSTKRNGS